MSATEVLSRCTGFWPVCGTRLRGGRMVSPPSPITVYDHSPHSPAATRKEAPVPLWRGWSNTGCIITMITVRAAAVTLTDYLPHTVFSHRILITTLRERDHDYPRETKARYFACCHTTVSVRMYARYVLFPFLRKTARALPFPSS